MNIQEIEEIQHNEGRATEFQNAYAVSRMTVKRERANPKAIDYLTKNGYYVAIATYEVCCPVTDALIGRNSYIINSSKNREVALGFLGGEESEEGYLIGPKGR